MQNKHSVHESVSKSYQADQTIRMECVMTGENKELPREQRLVTRSAPLVRVDRDEAFFEGGDVLLDGFGVSCGFVHFRFQAVDMCRVALERGADLVFEVIYDHKIWEEWQDIFDLQQVRIL